MSMELPVSCLSLLLKPSLSGWSSWRNWKRKSSPLSIHRHYSLSWTNPCPLHTPRSRWRPHLSPLSIPSTDKEKKSSSISLALQITPKRKKSARFRKHYLVYMMNPDQATATNSLFLGGQGSADSQLFGRTRSGRLRSSFCCRLCQSSEAHSGFRQRSVESRTRLRTQQAGVLLWKQLCKSCR